MSNLIERARVIADDAMGMEPEDRHTVTELIDRIEKLERVLVAAKKVTAIDAITITDANYLSYLEGAIAEVNDE